MKISFYGILIKIILILIKIIGIDILHFYIITNYTYLFQ